MQVTNSMVDKLAHLAKLYFSETEKEEIREDLQKMIAFVDQLNKLDLDGIEPLTHMSREVNVWRDDELKGSVSHEEAMQNAPDAADAYFTVPKVIRKI